MSWPIDEAKRLPQDRPVLFETGYGPSGLPHIGTFTEVARTTWVRQAFTDLTGQPSRLITFSDDMDGLRKAPDNVPNRELLEQYLGLPLTRIPDPFGTHESFGHHNNAKLRDFLDQFDFEYEFASSTDYYISGRFNAALFQVARCHEAIKEVVRPTLGGKGGKGGSERASNYSPFMPLHPDTHQVMQVSIDWIDLEHGTLHWRHDGQYFATSIYNGLCKLQWKADWAMRWYALGVDYEMSGKDLIESVKLSSEICRVLGGTPPVNLTYELFLDETGKKISKSAGNGLSMEEWLRYGPPESLAHYIFGKPQTAKKLFFGMIPRAMDDYLENRAKLASQEPQERVENPVWYVHAGEVPTGSVPVPFGLLLNLAGVANTDDPKMLLGYVQRYVPGTEESALLMQMIDNAIAFYQDRIVPTKMYRSPDENERNALQTLVDRLQELPVDSSAEAIQTMVFAVGNEFFKPLKGWFDCLYQILLGQREGPRFGVFVALYGIENTIMLVKEKLHVSSE